ncbi:MAG: methyltransferase family protein [Vulcanimicrobiaceae bacterium]
MAKERDVAGVIALPPLIYGIPLAASLVADRLLSKKRLPLASQALSIGFFIAAALLVAPALAEFKKANTAVDPFEETTWLVESGPFAHTRNPLYLGLTLTYIGIALAARATLPLTVLPGVLWVMNVGVIEREERYLERKFGSTYRKYIDRVPRWL